VDDAGKPTSEERPRLPFAVEEALAVFALAVLVALTFANVVVRYFTDQSFAVTEEISIFLMVAMVLAGASAAAGRDVHIRIEYFVETGSATRRRALLLFAALASAGFFFAFTYFAALYVWDEYRYGETTMALGLPRWWYSIWMPMLSAAIGLRALGFAHRLFKRGAP